MNFSSRNKQKTKGCSFLIPETQKETRSWKDVSCVIKSMDKLYDASFYSWVKSEDNIEMSVGHLKRVMVDYTAAQISQGIRWLIGDWTLGSITYLVKVMFIDDIWTLQSKSKKRKSICQESEQCPEFQERIQIIQTLVLGWNANFIAELISSLVSGWSIEQKRIFLRSFTFDWSFQQLSEVFIYIGSAVEWATKVNMLKRFSDQDLSTIRNQPRIKKQTLAFK